MRILVIGKTQKACAVGNYFALNDDYLVFSLIENTKANYIEIQPDNIKELREFALANEIDLTIVCDESLMDSDFNNDFNAHNLAILCPERDAARIALSKACGKKFIYKNKIKTPKFAIFEKPQLALDYARTSNYPLVIKPDKHSYVEKPFIAETFTNAKEYIEKLFLTGNKRIVLEEYIFGKEVSFYTLIDGFNPLVAGTCANYYDEIAIKSPFFVDDELRQKILHNAIYPTIKSLNCDGNEYIGILGFDFIVTDENFYLIEYNPFFKDLDADIILKGTNANWAKLFMSAITGTLLEEHPDIKKINAHYGAFRETSAIVTVEANTRSLLKEKLLIEGCSEDYLNEAYKLWKK